MLFKSMSTIFTLVFVIVRWLIVNRNVFFSSSSKTFPKAKFFYLTKNKLKEKKQDPIVKDSSSSSTFQCISEKRTKIKHLELKKIVARKKIEPSFFCRETKTNELSHKKMFSGRRERNLSQTESLLLHRGSSEL